MDSPSIAPLVGWMGRGRWAQARRRAEAFLLRLAGPVPGRYWLLLAGIFVMAYAFWHHYGRPYSGDHLYYTAMTFRYAGHSLPEALQLTAAYFDEPNIERLYYGFEDPDISPLIYPRVVYPALSVPFVLLLGGTGMYVVPLLSSIFIVWGLVRLMTRLFTKEIAVAVTSVFILTYAFLQFGTGLFTEGPVMAFVVGITMMLPLGGRRFGIKEAVTCSVLLVLITFTRQATPVVVSAVCAAWVWAAVRERRVRSNRWTLPVAVLLPVGLVCTFFLQWWAPYNPLSYYVRRNREPDALTAFSHFPEQAWRLLTRDGSYFQEDLGMLAIWMAALVSCVVLFKSVRTGLVVGAFAPSLVISTISTRPTAFRYYTPMYPFLIIAAAGLLYVLFVERARPSTDGSAVGGHQGIDGEAHPVLSTEHIS
jgi:hypothetical protein